uniref:vesicle-associated protein 1-2-like n=1 Tax=Erigeron canadensis TaxID=72917 RepID=UPI001CB9676D|nr:vesicle-associated protein 1-2-like [Erigeron canadensis]
MDTELLEIQPNELKFIFELRKQISCSIRLVNKSDHHVAFKVKTTSSTKYCARPITGVIKPNLTYLITVTMQAQEVAPPDLICNDKFLILSKVVPRWTKDDQITSNTFSKEDPKLIAERKLKVILVSPPHSPVLPSMNGMSRVRPYFAVRESRDDLVQDNPRVNVDGDIEVSRSKSELLEATKNKQSINRKHIEELRLNNDVEEMKSKLREFESILRQDNLRTNKNPRTGVTGVHIFFVFMVALASLYLGYVLHH